MPSDEEIIISFLFNRSGKDRLTSSEIYLTISMELKWYTLQEAKQFFSHILKNMLIVKDGDYYKPNFKYKEIRLPFGFTPSNKLFIIDSSNSQRTSLINEMVDIIIKETPTKKDDVLREINEISNKSNITYEVAAFLIAKEYNIDFSGFIKRVEKKIFEQNEV